MASVNFLEVSKYPVILFESTVYIPGNQGDMLKGNLTFRGVTREIGIEVKHIGEGNDPWGGYRSGFEGEVTISAVDYGLPEWVGDIEIDLIVEGIRQ